jgi:glycosyltransferase involved in cell wall biosynthesis
LWQKGDSLKLAILTRCRESFSLHIYRENIVRELTTLGIEVLPFTEDGPVPKTCDIVWEPGLAGSRSPHPVFKNTQQPIVATVHGAGPFVMKRHEIYPNLFSALRGRIQEHRTLTAWQWFRKKVSAVIAVSEYGAQEISSILGLPLNMIYSIHHGIDHDTFHIDGERLAVERNYLLHVSQYQPIKNVERIFAAYTQLPAYSRPELAAIIPRYKKRKLIRDIRLITEGLPPPELAKWYRGALGFVFPSLHETFGMPILEAMACGCPVITSNVSACPEVAGDAALLVDPRSVEDIANAMKRLVEDRSLRDSLRQKGLLRAQQFNWKKSAEEHLEVFKNTVRTVRA